MEKQQPEEKLLQLSPSEQAALIVANSQFFKARPAIDLLKSDDSSIESNKNPQEGIKDARAYFAPSNIWPKHRKGKEMRKKAARTFLHGVEVRQLQEPHILAGQFGLFAAKPFQMFDVVGEYTGEVVDGYGTGGEYVASLERSSSNGHQQSSLAVDAGRIGSECRLINDYRNIGKEPNCIMKTAYVEELPRIMIICKRDIAPGEEFLIDYSDEYWQATRERQARKPEPSSSDVSWDEIVGADY